jgi:predicted Ser/Thr protein kinase
VCVCVAVCVAVWLCGCVCEQTLTCCHPLPNQAPSSKHQIIPSSHLGKMSKANKTSQQRQAAVVADSSSTTIVPIAASTNVAPGLQLFDITLEIQQPVRRNKAQSQNCSYCTIMYSHSTASRHAHTNVDCPIRNALLILGDQDRDKIMGKVKNQGIPYGKLKAECKNIFESAQREEDRAAVEATVKELPRSLKRKSTALHHGADSKGVVISIDGEMMLTKQYDSAVPNVSKGARATNEYQLLQLLHNASIKVPRPFSYDEQAGTVTMQFITGFPLGDMLDEASPSPRSNQFVSEAQRKQLCQSLFYSVKKMHILGLFHGDLHANNVLVDGNLWAVYLLDFDNCDPRLAKPTAAGDVSDVLQIGRELLIGTSRGQLASLLAGEAYDSIIKFGQHAGGPNSSPWGATANRRGHQKTITQQHKQHLESEEAAGASKAKQLLERALEVTALTSGEADSVNPTSVGYVPTSAVMASAVPLAPPQPAQSSKKVKKK